MGLTDGGSAGAPEIPDTPGDDDLVVHSAELTPIGDEAYELRTGLRTQRQTAGPSSAAASRALRDGGLDSGDALTTVRERFVEKANMLADACQSIEEHLGVTISSHAAQEDDIAAGLRNASASAEASGLSPSQVRFMEAFGMTPEDFNRPSEQRPAAGLNPAIMELE
ncbi:hypothetical protein [Streptomyces sp. 6N223]|uniref:hypothetical protein n=1 Tax=Streptomyces sp. 6N223 TaxID=3457412 RepID=UPI003FD6B444